jgi:signal transduction histidine kinase
VLGLHGNEHPLQLDTLNIDLINALADYGGIAIGNAMMVSQLRELDRMKSEFVTSVSHDLRSPLTAILSYIELLERVGELNEMQRTFVGNVRSSVASITSLVNDLLALTRIEAGMDKEREPIRLSRVARPCVEDLRGRASVKGQTLSITVDGNEVPVYANPVRIRQVFNNLIDNAIKYTPEGGKISVHIRGAEGQVIIEVRDDGIGIPPEAQPHIFERFYRVKEVASSYDGTGLGLNIVSTIIQSYDGRIWVESLPAQGTTFTIMLPAYIEEKAPA